MLEKILITSFCVFAIWYTMQPGEIFGIVQDWFANLNEKLKQPFFSCYVCMSVWHGSYVYWIIWGVYLKTANWKEWLIVIVAAMGFNAILSQLFPKDNE